METRAITAKIDVSKIIKSKLFTSEKTGAVYLDLFFVPSKDNKFGDDYFIVQSQTKEERQAKVKNEILGNAKFLKSNEPEVTHPATDAETSDLPF